LTIHQEVRVHLQHPVHAETLNAQHARQVNSCVGAFHQLCTTVDGLKGTAVAAAAGDA
jgi:hypothetical protein